MIVFLIIMGIAVAGVLYALYRIWTDPNQSDY